MSVNKSEENIAVKRLGKDIIAIELEADTSVIQSEEDIAVDGLNHSITIAELKKDVTAELETDVTIV